jgi:subtilase family serine protease
MHLTGFSGGVTWKINGINLSAGLDSFTSHGGIYNVTAYSSFNGSALAYREIMVPGIEYQKLSVNSSITFDLKPYFEATVDYALEINTHGGANITVLNGDNLYSFDSSGFNATAFARPYTKNLNITLGPRPVTFSIFVFDAVSTLMVGNSSLTGRNGTYGGRLYIEKQIYLNATSPGYRSYSTNISPLPGSIYQTQISLINNGSNSAYITGELLDSDFNFHIPGSRIYLNGTLEGYSNQSGYFQFYATPGIENLSVQASLYKAYSEPLHVTNETEFLKIYLSPEDVSINSKVILSITRSFPFLFYFAYVSWTVYRGSNFSHYELFQSSTSSFYNSTTANIFTRGDGYTFLEGVTPLHKTYVALELYLNNSQEYSTGYVSMSYDNAVYFLANFAILVGILVYIYIMLDLLYLRKRRREWGLR